MIRFLLRLAAIRPKEEGRKEFLFAVVKGNTEEEQKLHKLVPIGTFSFQTADPDLIQALGDKTLKEHYLELGEALPREQPSIPMRVV